MRTSKLIIVLLFCSSSVMAELNMRTIGDSLMNYTGFSKVWSPRVRVKQVRVDGDKVTLRTNQTLHDYRWTPESVADVKRRVSMWVLGKPDGEVTIFSGQEEIEDLVTDCARGMSNSSKQKDLTERVIALWPSHGRYYNREREQWIWQRAPLWTTVEDLYSQEYVRLVKKMLENAGANVVMPRASIEEQELGVSGMPRWAEGARYWLQSQGQDSSIWNIYSGDEYKDDMKCRPLWVNHLDTLPDLCLALHTDGQDSGDDSTIIGTLVIYTAKDDEGRTTLRDGRDRETVNRNLADWIQTQLTDDLRRLAPEWTRRQLREANYCESRVPEVPSLILEVLSHKNMADMKYGLDPKFRFTASRAIYKGILRYLNGQQAVVQPLPVEQLSIRKDGLLRWKATSDPYEPSAKPSYYMVYVQANDGEWDVQQVENATQVKLTMERGVKYNYYVVAGNDGGLSMPSPMISAYLSERDNTPVALIVDAFDDCYAPEWFADSTYAGIVPGSYACEDRISCAYVGQQWNYRRGDPWVNDDNCGFGACYRDHAGEIIVGNTRDWSAQHGHILRKMRISYVSATAELAEVDSTYTLVDVVCGRQREPLSEVLRDKLTTYVEKGGKLLMSTDHYSAIEPEWAAQYLHASYYAAQATHNGRIRSPRHRLYQLVLEPNEEQLFSCRPEGLKIENGGVRMAEYLDMSCTAAVGFEHKTLVYGFPLEAIMDFEKIYRHSLEWLLER